MKHAITIEIDDEASALASKTDAYIAECWHVAQANPAPHSDRYAGFLAERIGREIIRRWLASPVAGPELYRHQGHDHYWDTLRKHGSWPGPTHDTWVYEPGKAEREAAGGSS